MFGLFFVFLFLLRQMLVSTMYIIIIETKIFEKPLSEQESLLMDLIYFEISVWFSEGIYGTTLPVSHVSNGQLTVVKHLEHYQQISRKLLTACYLCY